MGEGKRFDMFFERHIGLGIHWDDFSFPLHLSISIMCLTITIGFGSYPATIDDI